MCGLLEGGIHQTSNNRELLHAPEEPTVDKPDVLTIATPKEPMVATNEVSTVSTPETSGVDSFTASQQFNVKVCDA